MALVCACYYYLPFFQRAKPAIYLMTILWYFVILALYDIVATWSQQALYWKIKFVGAAVIASVLTLWSILCLVGIVNYPLM